MVLVTDNRALEKAIMDFIKDYPENTVKIHNCDDVLDAFCENEARFRLTKYYGFTEDSLTDEIVDDVSSELRATIDNCEPLYDALDKAIDELGYDLYYEENDEELE